MVKKLLIFVAALVVAFLAYIALLPAEYRVARSAEMAATPEEIFPHINSLKKFNDWSPWAKIDPNATATFEGPDSGQGAVLKWKGNEEVGEGSMTIVDTKPLTDVDLRLDFVSPYPGTADVAFDLEPSDGKTKVTWAVSGQQSFVERAICTLLMLDMDQMIGEMYEEGLANLKGVVEGGAGT